MSAPPRFLTVQDVDAAARARRAAARERLPAELARRSAGRPWRYVLFGSIARGDFHPWSDADIAVIGGEDDLADAERAAHEAAAVFGVPADVIFWEEMSRALREEVRRDGVPCD